VLASLRSAVPAKGEIVLESTPNGAGGVFYEEWQQAAEMGYQKFFFPWWYADEYRKEIPGGKVLVLTDEEMKLVHEGLTLEQIEWRREKWAELRGYAAQEFAEDDVGCFRASGECVFDMNAINRAMLSSGEPLECKDNLRLMIWLPAKPEKQYIVGVDPAGGGSEGDYSCAQVIDRQSAMQCAELHGHFPPRDLALRVLELAALYNNALIAVERNNHGHAVLAVLRSEGYGHIFRQGEQDGWLTSVVSRPAMIENLAAMIMLDPMLVHSPRLLKECRTFVRLPDGSTAAGPGTHDDCVMAMGIAQQVRREAVGQMSREPRMVMASLANL
nr:terminase [Terriglobales bacterium]